MSHLEREGDTWTHEHRLQEGRGGKATTPVFFFIFFTFSDPFTKIKGSENKDEEREKMMRETVCYPL
jgi:hypothetical protein